jgi:hypothetical protein
MEKKVAILITAHCDSPERMYMTEKLLERLSKTGYYLCLVSHTPVSENIQKYCHGFVYDHDNSFLVDGQLQRQGHGVAEQRSILDGATYLKERGFTHLFKVCYDLNPNLNFEKIIQDCIDKDKKWVGTQWSGYVNTLVFLVDIDFLKYTFSFEEFRRYPHVVLEETWYLSMKDKGLLGDIYGYTGPDNAHILNIKSGELEHFSIYNGNTYSEEYKNTAN